MSLTDRISALTPEQRVLFEKLREKQRKAASVLKPPPIPRVTGPTAEGDWPLSLDQERYWFMEQLFPGGAGLNITAATRLRGPLSPEILAMALAEIARRHAAWRTIFPAVDGRPVQRVLATGSQRLQIVDLSGLPAAGREPEAFRLVEEETAAPFDLARGPLVRSVLVRLGGEDHVCLLTIHHLVTDFISSHIAWTELAALYSAFAAGGRPALPEPPVQYPDFAVWQRQWLQGEVLVELTSWWRDQLAGFPPVLDLPTDRPHPAEIRLRGGRLAFTLEGGLADGLRGLARQEGATLFMLVLALTAALLHRDSGQERLILGANNANRNRPEIEPVLGCFLTQVPFPLDLTGDPSFRELIALVRRSALGSYAHQDLPFGQLVQALQLARDPGRQPLIQTLVQVLDGQYSQASLAGATSEPVDAWDGRARYDLMLTFFEAAGGGLDGALEYDADLFDAATTVRRVERFLVQAAAVVADPDLPLSALPVLGRPERHQALVEWNDTARPAVGWTAPERFAAQAARTPEALAVTAAGETLSYGELDRRSAALAHRLRALGAGPESRVALLLDRTVDVPVAILGVWKAGGSYVPLDLDSPAERLAGLLADAEPAAVVHRGALPVPLAAETASLDLDRMPDATGAVPPLPAVGPEDLAYLIYTSGTTGRPKAVMVEHGSLASVLASFIDHVSLGPGDRVACFTRYTFDPSLLDIVAPLLTGGNVEILARDEVLDPESVLAAFSRSAVAFAVPSLLRRVVSGARALGPRPFAGLRVIWAGGEVVSPELQRDLLAAFPDVDLAVAYGPTEATIICTFHRVPRGRPLERALIGRPLPDAEVWVVDPRGEPVPPGLPGELWIGGAGVARGYFRRDELTAERFVTAGGRRFYRTGDLVRQVPAEGGALEFLGRTDLQVKVRGFRIEPGEVEAALRGHPAVRDTVVVARSGAGGDSQLVAYVVGEDGVAPPLDDLRAVLRARLPEHMIPSLLVPLAALPLGANGKVDRKALPAPLPVQEAPATAAPRDDREARLAEIWRAVLGREQVGIHDNFFQLGGDSILSIQVVARARQEGLLITPRQLFENQTVAGLAAVAGQGPAPEEPAGGTPSGFSLAGLDRQALDRLIGDDPSVEDLYPLAPMQQGILFHSLYTADADLYVEQLTAELAGPLDGAAFSAAWQRVVERHPALRTAFLWQGVERPLQLVRGGVALPWKVEDWRGLPPAAREERWRDLLAADRARGFDLGRPPLLRLTLVRLDEEVHRLVWSFHHLLFDGWCFSLLLTEVFTLYQAASAGREAHLPPPPRPFRDYIAWLIRRDEAEAESFWRQRLRGFTAPTPVPFDGSGVTEGGRADDYHERTVALPAPLTAGLEALAQRLRVTLNTLVQGAWALLLSRYAQDPEVVFGVVVSGRPPELPGVESMVGLFINTLPARVEIPEGEPLSAWLPRLQTDQLEMRQHEWLPLARVQALSEVPPGEPLLTSLLAFENYPVDPAVAESLGKLRIVDVAVAERTNYPLTLTVVARGTLSLRLTALRRFEPATARRMLAHLENLLGALAAGPERLSNELPLLAPAERHQLTAEWNDTAAAYPDEASIPALFAEQAVRRPDAPALLSPGPGAVLTYRELDERSAALAAELARRGVRRGDLVGLFAERSPELVTALLAVLRAGAAYLPLDPSYPRERLALMLADTGDPLVLVQEGLAGLPAPARTLPLHVPVVPGVPAVPEVPLSGDDLAYVLYTSGSTGTPKGVAVSHRSVARLVRNTGYATFGPDEVFLMMAPVSFDASTFELWGPLLNGGRLAILPPGEVSLGGLEGAVRDFGVTTLWLTAGLFHLVVDERPSALAPLRQLLAGGDVLSPAHVERLRRELPALRLVNGYGPTESTTFTACGEVGEMEPGAGISIGRPIANTRVLVLGRDLQPAPVGVPGELYAGGDGLALGYLGRPDLTAAAFVPAPFGAPGERLYRTGDLVRRLPDGRLDFLGRADDQVKVRGFRIEPGEIEAALAVHPEVREAAVVAPKDEGRARRLVAFAVPRGEARDSEAVLAQLAARLPAWMVPSALIWLDALPLSPTGKMDRAALLSRAAERGEEDLTPPRNAAEEILAAVWRQVLRRERIGVHDSFFRLGGDSILSIQIVARARQVGLVVTPRQIFEEQTVAALAAVATPLAAAEAEPGEVSGETPLTPVQRYFFAAEPADPHHFNQSLLLRPAAPLAPVPLGRALTTLVAHHDALRLRFEGGRRAWIAPREEGDPLTTLDLSALPPEGHAGALEAAAASLQAGFALARGPLFRAARFLLGEDERLFLVAHHLVVDGVSWRILLDDLKTAYQGMSLPARTTSWKRWAERLAEHAASAEVRSELPFWINWLVAPTDVAPLPREGGTDAGLGFTTATLGREATRALLGEAPAAYATQVNDLLLAALVQTFARWTGEPRLRFDLEGHGREEIAPDLDLSRTVGWFTTIFPVTLDVSSGAGPGDLIRGVKEALRVVPRRGLGYGLLRYLEGDPELAAIPDPEVAFNYLGQLDAALGGPGGWELAAESAGPVQSPRQGLRHAVEVNAWVLAGELRVSWSYDRSRLSPATAGRLVEGYAEALAALVAHCVSPEAGGRTPSDFPLARLDPRTLDTLTGTGAAFDPTIEDLYPPAPLQEGMLFQGLLAPESELYFEHLTAEFAGPLDARVFARAWQAVVDRHPALRTAFAWEGLARPLQVVRRGVELPWTEEDWRGVPREEQPARLAAWLAADRARPFDLARPPLMRGALLRTAEDRHRFVWSFHHLLIDGWCFSLIFHDVFAFYQAMTIGRVAVLPPVRPYRDFIAWVARQDEDAAARHFRQALAGFTASTPLPLDRPALPPGDDDGPRDLDLRLSPSLVDGLNRLARSRDLTLNTLAQGTWGLVLSRHGGGPDVVFGSVVSGRPAELPGVESMIGLFINTLPVRLAADPQAPVDRWLAEVQERLLEVRQHETAALAQVQRASEVPPGEPLFQSLVAFESYPVDESLGEGAEELAVTEVTVSDRTDYPLSLAVLPGRRARSELVLRLSYDRRTDAATAHRLLLQMERLLGAFAADPERLLGDFLPLSAAERHQLTLEWNNLPAEEGIDLLRALAPAQDLAAVAVAGEDGRETTYAELERRANQLAHRLIALGVGPETRVALLAERSAEAVVAILGILKAGGVWVPVDPETPPERAAFLIADSRPALVLVLGGEGMAGRLPEIAVPAVSLDAEHERIAAASGEPPAVAVDPGNLAYVIYTSGSTGTPKGVAVSHRAAAAYVRTAARVYGLAPGDRVLHHYSLAFDMSVQEIFATLAGGAAIVPHTGPIEEPARFLAECAARGITAFDIPAAYWHQIAAAVESEGLRLPASLRLIVTGGERPLAERWTAWSGGARLINAYGPTETTIGATFHERPETPDPLAGRREVPLGRLMAGMRAHVVDRDLRPVPAGGLGELILGGSGVARGYLGRPDLTAERFVPDALSGEPGERLYRSGDLVRLLADGSLEFAGRIDGQVKVRGFRVELGEVEAVLASHPGLREVAVAVRPGGDALLAAVVPADPANPPDLEALRSLLVGRLPAYMIPTAWAVLPALPLTPNGKLDRRALGRLEAMREGDRGTPPSTPAEKAMADLWCQILGVADVRLEDDFFVLGGHSLLATQLASRVRAAFGVELPLRVLFDHPLLGDLTASVTTAATGAASSSPIPRRPADLDPIPASYAQERLWLLERLRPGAAYNMFDALRARGELSPPLLEAVLGEVVRRHEALRTTFREAGGQPAQVIAPPGRWTLPQVDLTALPEAARLEMARRLAAEEPSRPFDLARGPLLRVLLLRLNISDQAADHALLLTMHHIVSDGWSMGVLVREITALYAAARAGAPSPLPPLPIQYADFAVWQRRWLAAGELDRQLDYWRRKLAGAPSAIDLPLDRPRAAVTDPRGARVSLRFGAELSRALVRLARRHDATLFMVLLAAFQALLLRLSGQEDLPVGSGIANRNRAEIEPLIGFFVNAVVLRGDLSGDPGFAELLARVRDTTLETYAHQDLPFERLVEELRPERSLAANPLFQVSFVLQNAPAAVLDLPGLSLSPFEPAAAATRFDLELYAWEAEGALGMALYYAVQLFDPTTIQRLAGHLERLLAGVVEDPAARLSALPLLAAAERHQLLREWNDTRLEIGGDFRGVPALVAEQARRDPGATALEHLGRRISYGEMGAQAGRLARRLVALGVGPEVMVGVHLERSAEMVIGELAVLMAGGAYVPLDPVQPDDRLAHIAAETRMPVVLTRERELAWAGGAVALRVDEEGEGAAPDLGLSPVWPESTAYVIYTSGSTGRPKGVPISHAALLNMTRWEIGTYGFAPGVRKAQVMAPGFDAAVGEIWPSLASGASLCIADEETRLSPAGLLAWMAAGRIELCVLPTPLGELFLELAERELPPGLALRTLLVGGDRLKRFPAPSLPFPVVNNYGPTETAMVASIAMVERAGEPGAEPWRTPAIGRPVANARLLVLDRALQPVPVGVAGELAIGGIGLSRGYVGRPDLTAEAFVPDPFSLRPGGRLYRTGDRVRLRPDGRLDFLERLDAQVKVRGFRVELGEIEAVLASHPGLREVAVAVRSGGDALLAAVVPADPANPPDLEVLRSFLAGRLPAYMVPAAWAVLPGLPLTAHSKVDRQALASLGVTREAASRGTPPSTPAEKAMADLWREILGVEEVRLEDDFFALGGHSLLATQLASRVRAAFGVELPLRRLFETPRLGDLTAVVTAWTGTASSSPIPRRPADLDPIPASFAQERLWFLDRVHPGNPAYNMFDALRAEGDLSPALLAAAFREVARRHEALRTTFEESGGRPAQVIAPPPARWPLPIIDLSALPEEARLTEAGHLAAAEAERPFDLARGPLLRSLLLRLGAADHVLLLGMHHVVSDGWSMGVLVREATALYATALAGRPSPFPELAIQYADFAVWQRRWLSGDELERQLSYWRRRLAGMPAAIDLPFDRPRPARPTYRGGLVAVDLGPEVGERLRRLARGSEATLFMVLLAAFQVHLRRLTGQQDLPLGSPIANRNRTEIEPLIGFFVNMLVLRGEVAGDPPFPALLARVREETLEAYAHQDLPFDRLVEELRPERSLAVHPLFQIICVLQNAPMGAVELPGLTFSGMAPEVAATRFDLELQAVELPDGVLSAAFIYSTDLFDNATIERLSGALQVLLRALAEDPSRRISELPLLRPEELHQLLTEWSPAPAEAPALRCLHQRFEAQVDRASHAPAVTVAGAAGAPGERLTYGELDSRANQLARHLQARGVRPGDRVVLLLERSAEMVVAILGALKAGAAYVPIDPAYPQERVAFLREDSGASLLITAGDLEALDSYPSERLGLPLDPDLPAYVIYTSGSTGTPKGVVVTHANVDRLFTVTDPWFEFSSDDVWTLFHSYAFDFSVWELWGALRYGGRLLVLSFLESRDPASFYDLLREERVTVLNQTPSAFRQLVWASEGKPADLALRYVIFGGEALEPASLAPWIARHGDRRPRLINMYGITETTVHVTYRPLEEADLAGGSRIGRPIPDLAVHLFDAFLQPVPLGVPGEIHVGGAGLAQGYLDRPALTAERFVPDPFSGSPGARLYRSGDLARRLPDGDLEYLGRIDHQVKLRGYRIELGEIESALARHPEVREAVALLRRDGEGDRLVAWVVPREAADVPDAADEAGQVAQWQTLYDETYGLGLPAESGGDPTFNVQGWNSTYTGQPIPAGEMRQWVDATVGQILELPHGRVLEVGCGTGLLLYRVAPSAGLYLGTDFSARALEGIRGHLGGALPQVELRQGLAHDVVETVPEGLDLVILNSVVQYFPGVDYLVRVLAGAVRSVAPGGAVFVGDVRSLPLLPALYASVELFQAPDSMPAAELRRRIGRRLADEEELAVDPRLFLALVRWLPAVSRVEVRLKPGRYDNELSRFRYDVVLHVGGTDTDGARTDMDGHRPWRSVEELERLLGEGADRLAFSGIPDARTAGAAVALERLESFATVEELRAAAARASGIDPEDLRDLAGRLGYEADLAPGAPGRFDAVFRRRGAGVPAGVAAEAPVGGEPPWSEWANDPLRSTRARRLPRELRRFLEAELPDHMIPASIAVLDALPLTAHGKVDRSALARLEVTREAASQGTPPSTPAERAMADLWREILGVEEVRLEDDFFALGGHSLLATQLASRVRAAFGVELPLRRLFETPRLGDLTAMVTAMTASAGAASSSPIPRRPADLDPVPASFAQERLWFLDRVHPGNPAYNMPDVLRAAGELSPALLAAAFREMARRHEALRTTFTERGGRPVQVIAPPPVRWPLPVVDLSALPEEARLPEAGRLAAAETVRPFDLARGPLLRTLLLRLAPTDHVLLLGMHHVVSDGWSMGVLVREATALYAAALAGRPSPFPELAIQYADFAVWQRRWLSGDELERQLSYWRQQLAGIPAAIDLPFDRPRPARPAWRGALADARLGPEVTEGLRRLARGSEATLFMVLLAAFQVHLRRLTGQQDLPLGSPIANRNRTEIEPLIGFFVNMLVLRGEVAGDPPFPALLARVREETLEAYAHQDLPFDRLVEELRPERSLAVHPLFQIICVLQNAPMGAVELPGLTFSGLAQDVMTTRFDLELQATELPDGSLAVPFYYSTDLFDAATAARLSSALVVLLQALAEDPSRRISELPLLRPEELHQLLVEWSPAPVEAPALRCLHERFEAQVDRAPHAPAVTVAGAAGAPLTYGELDARANRLARHLQARGVRPGDRVALLLERSAEMVVAILGALKAGAAYVPIDPAYPQERVAFLREDSGAALLLTAGDLEALDSYPSDRLGLPLDPDLPAYVIYTSGSTGSPKGVAVTHANVDRLFMATDPWLSFGAEDVWTLFHSYAFDFSVWELWGALRYGGRLLVLSFLESRDPAGFYDLLREERVTVLNQTPSAFRQLVWASEGKPADLALRYVIFGGEALEPASLAPWIARHGDQRPRLINMYGITETTVHVTYRPLEEADLAGGSRIGRPIPDLAVHLLDAFLQPVPLGVPGEIHVGGAGLAQGYLDRPALTAERFVPDPFSGTPGARLYRSGDLARRLPDGDLEYLGRIDHQVKLRGYRIELGEIESALARHPRVREAVALLRRDPDGDRLVAWVVPREAPVVELGAADEARQVAQWQTLYDETYARGLSAESGEDPTFNLQGWDSSYTGQPIPAEEMREWVKGTVERLLALEHRRVLEVGCGTGLLLFRVAPHAERYRGLDFSAVALAQVRAGLDRLNLPQVELARGTADDWSGVRPGDFDLVVLNSVVQYFPDVDYLVRVLEGAVGAVAPGGAVFIGDVRGLPLLEAFHTSVRLHQAPGSLPARELAGQVRRGVLDEEELVLDPELFLALARRLPAVRRVQVRIKRGRCANELTRFRYDVVLHVGRTDTDGDWTDTDGHHRPWGSLAELARTLGEGPATVVVAGIPDARLAGEAAALEVLESGGFATVEEMRAEIARRVRERPGVDPEALWTLAGRLGYEADLGPSGPDGRFTGRFRRRGTGLPGVAPGEGGELPWSAWANDPLRAGRQRRLVPELRRFLEAELPEPMVPSAFVLLDALPLNVNAKVDRAALPAPDRPGASAEEWVAPSTSLEELLTGVAAEVLGAPQVGLRDNFFALGGHSLLATQLVSRLAQQHGLPVTLQMVFDAADLGELADRIVEAELAAADSGLLDEEIRELLGAAGPEEDR